MTKSKILFPTLASYLVLIIVLLFLFKLECRNLNRMENFHEFYADDSDDYYDFKATLKDRAAELMVYNLNCNYQNNPSEIGIYKDNKGTNLIETLEFIVMVFFLTLAYYVDPKILTNRIQLAEPIFAEEILRAIRKNKWSKLIPFGYRFALANIYLNTNIEKRIQLLSNGLTSGSINQETFNTKKSNAIEQSNKLKMLHYFKISEQFIDLYKLLKNNTLSKSEFEKQREKLFSAYSESLNSKI